MKTDNDWHDGILYQPHLGDVLAIADNLEEAEKDNPGMGGGVEPQEIKYNWNNGRPLVDLGDDCKIALEDLQLR